MSLECRLLPEAGLFDDDVWRAMHNLAPYGVFAHRVFLRQWRQTFQEERAPFLLQVFGPDGLVAFLPAFVADQPYFRGALKVRELRFFMDDFLVSPPRAPIFIRPDWRARLSEILQASVDFAQSRQSLGLERILLGPLADGAGPSCRRAEEEEFVLPFAAPGQDPLDAVPHNTARNVRRRLRALDREFPQRWSVTTDRPTDDIVRRFIQIKRASWNRMERCTFDDPRFAAFVTGSFARCERARCVVCRINDQIVGIDLLLAGGDELLSYNSCYDRRFARFGIGRVMTWKALEAFGQSSSALSLGLGDHPQKREWGASGRSRYRLDVWRSGTKRLAFAAAAGMRSLARLPSGIRARA